MNTKVQNRSDNHTGGSDEGVIKIVGSKELPGEFITVGKSFSEALGRASILDERQRNAIIIYKAQLEMFEMNNELNDLTDWVNASIAIGGINRSLAAMAYTGIYTPDGAGIKLDKDSKKVLIEMQRMRAEGHQNEHKEED